MKVKVPPTGTGYQKLFQAALGEKFAVMAEERFHPKRLWRLDLVIRPLDHFAQMLAVEIDGGGFVSGRHSRGKGIENDCEKYFEAMKLGYRILRVTPKHIKDGRAFTWIEALLR